MWDTSGGPGGCAGGGGGAIVAPAEGLPFPGAAGAGAGAAAPRPAAAPRGPAACELPAGSRAAAGQPRRRSGVTARYRRAGRSGLFSRSPRCGLPAPALVPPSRGSGAIRARVGTRPSIERTSAGLRGEAGEERGRGEAQVEEGDLTLEGNALRECAVLPSRSARARPGSFGGFLVWFCLFVSSVVILHEAVGAPVAAHRDPSQTSCCLSVEAQIASDVLDAELIKILAFSKVHVHLLIYL